MDRNKEEAIIDVTRILEAEPWSVSDNWEKLAVLVASGKAKEMNGVSLNQDQVKKLSEKRCWGVLKEIRSFIVFKDLWYNSLYISLALM